MADQCGAAPSVGDAWLGVPVSRFRGMRNRLWRLRSGGTDLPVCQRLPHITRNGKAVVASIPLAQEEDLSRYFREQVME